MLVFTLSLQRPRTCEIHWTCYTIVSLSFVVIYLLLFDHNDSYNNANFTDSDWDALLSIGKSSKKEDTLKVKQGEILNVCKSY